MLSKYIKSVFILLLIFSFNVNTFAQVSVSDGSAFVTKGEFSSRLNSISNRMAQLESSFESKIDNLVSSYLSRNGLWSGQAQSLSVSSFIVGAYGKTSGSYNYYYAHGNQVQSNNSNSSFTVDLKGTLYALGTYDDVTKKKLFTPNKTGLAFIKLYWQTRLNAFHTYLVANSGSYEMVVKTVLTFTSDVSLAKTSNSYNYTFAWGAYDNAHSIKRDKYETILLFVSKGNDVTYSTTNTTNVSNMAFLSSSTVSWTVYVQSANVY